ncbi:MAG TPA: hypothetical protein VMX55_06870 [candidate division Zixibacteria bacterium]|nr:hypothetical protein [candidate division Zixibacteria bacterium]
MDFMNSNFVIIILFFSILLVPIFSGSFEISKTIEENYINTPSIPFEAFDATPPGDNLTELSVIDDVWGMYSKDVYINGSYAYICTEEGGLVAVDINDPENPEIISYYWDEFAADDVYVEDEYIFLGHGYAGFTIINGSDVANLEVIGHVDTQRCKDVNIVGNFAYLSTDFTDMSIYDISDKTNPTSVGTYNNATTYAEGIAINGSFAFVCQSSYGLHVVNISNPSSPIEVSYFNHAGYYQDIIIEGTIGYVAASGGGGLQTIDFSDINNPVLLDQIAIGNAFDIEKNGDIVCVNDYTIEARFYNVSDPANIITLTAYSTPTWGTGNHMSGDLAAITDKNKGLYLVNISQISATSSPVDLGECFLGGQPKDTFVDGDLLFVAKGYGGLSIYNISNPLNPVFQSNIPVISNRDISCVYISNGIAYVGIRSYGLAFIDYTDPQNPSVLNTVLLAASFERLFVQGGYTFAAALTSGLRIFNTTDIMTASYLSQYYDAPGQANGIYVNGSYAFLADGGDGVEVINLTDITSPVEVTSYDNGGYTLDVKCVGEYLIIADSYDGVEILDASDITSLSQISRIYDGANAEALHIEEDMMCVADYRDGFEFINWSDPANPQEVAQYDIEGNPEGVYYYHGIAYGAAGDGGVRILAFDHDEDNVSTWLEINVYGSNHENINSDSDSLSDGDEVYTYYTDPILADTDNDDLDDDDEIFTHLTNPLDEDTDDDLVRDGDEIIEGTNPLEPDSDFDGLDDRQELDRGTDPWDADSDDDLLTDGDEVWSYGSNPLAEDTDSDGLDDWEEVNPGTDGLLTSIADDDSDDDGILDGNEATYGTSPLDGDCDNDNILDGEEIIAGVDGFITDPLDADTDSDGYNDDIEIAEGTDPTDPDDYPGASTPTPTPTPTNTTTTTDTGSFIGGFISLGIVTTIALVIIILVERRKKFLEE